MAQYQRIPRRRKTKKHQAVFFKTEGGNYPAREFLQKQDDETKREIGTNLLKIELEGINNPILKKELDIKNIGGIWQFTTEIPKPQNRTYRIFCNIGDYNEIVILHIILKKSKKGIETPKKEVDIARKRAKIYKKFKNNYHKKTN